MSIVSGSTPAEYTGKCILTDRQNLSVFEFDVFEMDIINSNTTTKAPTQNGSPTSMRVVNDLTTIQLNGQYMVTDFVQGAANSFDTNINKIQKMTKELLNVDLEIKGALFLNYNIISTTISISSSQNNIDISMSLEEVVAPEIKIQKANAKVTEVK